MSIPPIAPIPVRDTHLRFLDKARLASLAVLVALFVLCVAFSWTTRGSMAYLPFLNHQGKNRGSAATNKAVVDLRPWQTAQTLASLAVTAEETEYAQQAEHLADHEVDQAFASALRQANLKAQHRTFTGEALVLSQKVEQLKQLVAQDQAQVDSLTPAPAVHAKPSEQPAADSDDLQVAKAQLGLDSDQLDDAQDDLNRASGDDRSEIQGELSAHEEAMKKFDNLSHTDHEVAVTSVARYGTLAGRVKAWFKQRSRYQLIMQAASLTQDDIRSLTSEHNALEAQANAKASAAGSASDHASKMADLKSRSAERQLLSIYGDRILTEQQLATVYGKWSAQVLLQHNTVWHLILQSLALIFFILICMVLGDALVRKLMDVPTLGHKQRHTLRNILELSIQVLGLLLILLVIFGTPQQMPTILGLATAGITIVLQDFILAFFGWFVLMGKNGIRVGDRVEINGVGGEVTEVGLINTTLLETGNLADKGLPTGRRISFINSFAIRGQYFNFSTAGQWMWDEITINLPTNADPRAMAERIQQAALEETQEGAQTALEEWKHGAHSDNLSRFNSTPVVSLLPSASGFNIQIRYITRASERFDTRSALYKRIFDLIQAQGEAAQVEQKGGAEVA